MERSPVRYAAFACVVAGGLLMSGPSVVALADEPSDSGDDGSTSVEGDPEPAAAPASEPRTPHKWPVLGWLSTLGQPSTPRVGPIAPPEMELPKWLAPTTPDNRTGVVQAFVIPTPTTANTNSQSVGATVSDPEQTQEQRSTDATAPGNTQTVEGGAGNSPVQTPAQGQQAEKPSPAISVVPPGAPGFRIKNPLPDIDELPIDLHEPVLPQVLRFVPPLLAVMTVAEQVPLVNLVATPLMNATLPPFIADVLVPALLSDIVIPTFSFGNAANLGTVPTSSFAGNQTSLLALPGSGPPAEIAPMGMDMPLAPGPGPTPPAPQNPPQPPQPPTPPDDNVGALSENVAFRAGYSDYLRNAGMAQVTAIAVPGAVGILLFTIGGGFIGYRQARAGHVIRAEGIGRFLR